MSRSFMLDCEYAVDEFWRRGDNILYQIIRDVYFLQERAELIGTVYAILEWFADGMRSPKQLMESAGIPSN